MEERKLELQEGTDRGNISQERRPGLKAPKLEPFKEEDDITAYLIRFENIATLCEWPSSEWPARLAILFTATTLDAYSTLSDEEVTDYMALKEAILKAFKKTPENYCKEFRSVKITPKTNFSQLLTKLYWLFDYWFDSSGFEESFSGLRDLFVLDQFLVLYPQIKLKNKIWSIPEK